MRKAWILLMTLLVMASVGFGVAQYLVNLEREAVTWEEETIYGDQSAVAGVQIRTRNHMNQHLYWETVGTLGTELNPETTFTFTNTPIEGESEQIYWGLGLSANQSFLADLSFGGHERISEASKEKYADLIAYCLACYESVEVGTEKEFSLDLGEYLDFYSLSGHVVIPDAPTQFVDEFSGRMEAPTAFTQAVHEFFRIPILGDYKVNFTINRKHNGASFGSSYAGGVDGEGIYNPEFDSIYMNGNCYLTFNPVAPNGEIADTSQIPGGYGLYRANIGYGETGLVWESPVAEMVYAMDPSVEFSHLEKSDDDKHLYIHTWQDNKLIRTILDEQTMEVLQEFELYERENHPKYGQYETIGDFYTEVKQYDDFLAILQFSVNNEESEKNTVTVFAEDDRGLYHHKFTVPMSPETVDVNDDLLIYSSVTNQLEYDGEQLYVVQNVFQDVKYGYARHDNCDFYVMAYNPEGIAYVGKYHVNLTDIHYDSDYGSSAVLPFYDGPVDILAS